MLHGARCTFGYTRVAQGIHFYRDRGCCVWLQTGLADENMVCYKNGSYLKITWVKHGECRLGCRNSGRTSSKLWLVASRIPPPLLNNALDCGVLHLLTKESRNCTTIKNMSHGLLSCHESESRTLVHMSNFTYSMLKCEVG